MTVGKGTKSGVELGGIIDEIERINAQIKELQDQRSAVFAEAKGNGFDTKAIRRMIAERKLDPAERAENEAIADTYRHALGMVDDDAAPLAAAALEAAGVDLVSRDAAAEFLKSIVPPGGELILKIGGVPLRAWRTAEGKAKAEDMVEPLPSIEKPKSPAGVRSPAGAAEDGAPDDPEADELASLGGHRHLTRGQIIDAVDRAERRSALKRKKETAGAE